MLAAALIAIAVYANSLDNGMVLDDAIVIRGNPALQDPLDWRRIFLTPSWFAHGNPTIPYRPVTTWTFALNHALHGEHPFGYHLGNVLGHAAVSALLVSVATWSGLPASTAGLAGALFAVHPIHTEAVANGVGRAEILACGFALLSLLAGRRATGAALVGAALAYGLALLSKENAIVFLALLPLGDLLFTDGGSLRLFVQRLRGRRAFFYAALLAVTLGYLALRASALGSLVGGQGARAVPYWHNAVAHSSTDVRVLTALEVQARAIWLLFVPLHLSADYSYRQIPLVSSFLEPAAWTGLLVAAALVAVSAILWRRRAAFFWLMVALASYGIVSNIAFPIGTIFGERLLYLPSAGFCVLLAIGFARATAGRARGLTWAFAGTLLAVWGVRAALRNPVWHDELGLAQATVASAPNSALAHHLLGVTYWELGREREAIEELGRALTICPDHVDALFNLGTIHMLRQRPEEALVYFRRVIDIEPRHLASWVNSAAIYNERGDFQAALEAADHAVAIRPDAGNAHVMRGYALRGVVRLAEARASFERALRLPNPQPDALLGFAETVLEQGDVPRATVAFERLVQAAPSAQAYRGLVTAYRRSGREADAARVARAARARYPDTSFFP